MKADCRVPIFLLLLGIISAIGQTAGAGTNQWRVVVVDQPSLKIISTVLKMPAILEQNVLAVQLITKNRQPYPDVDAIYVLVPCAESIAHVIDDFTPTSDPPLRAKYARAHLYFTGALSDPLFSKLSASAAAPYIKGIAELYIEYNPIESRVFLTTPSERPFFTLYSPSAAEMRSKDIEASADRVLSVVASLGIRPYVRYYRPPGSATTPAETMANRLQSKLDDYCAHERRKAENYKEKQAADLQTSTVIVLDRSVDIYAPLIHEFAYQAMVHDLIDLESGDRYVYNTTAANGEVQRTEAELAEATDPLWVKLRHQHISHVSQTLVKCLDQLVSENVGIKALASLSKRPTLNEMRAALAELPEFKRLQSSEHQSDVRSSSRTRYTWETIDRHDQDELGPRFVPAVKSVVSEHIAGTLSTEMFPWVQQAPPEGIPKHILNTNATSLRR
ncbi:syntaxin binding protein 1 [Coemansia sp. S155-1]|nr:syntaxin binding protein 1 [Coemansia sp. S155-1]